jgi:hypothetical protein
MKKGSVCSSLVATCKSLLSKAAKAARSLQNKPLNQTIRDMMQRSIDKFNKSGKISALTARNNNKANQTNGEKKTSSKLVGILNSHLTRTKRYTSSKAQKNDDNNKASTTQYNTSHPSINPDQLSSPPPQQLLATCPICLKEILAETYDNHMHQELQDLLTSSDDNNKLQKEEEEEEEVEIIIQRKKRKAGVDFLKTNHPPRHQQRQNHPHSHPQHPHYNTSAPPQFNHYGDHYGCDPILAPEADDIGLDGAPQGLAWEGAGFTELM